jgi:HEAT repeat protein
MNRMRTVRLVSAIFIILANSAPLSGDKRAASPEELLRAYGVDLATPTLIGALSNNEPVVREMAAKVLATRSDQSALPELRKQLADKYVYARLAAAFALVKLDDLAGKQVLTESLASPVGTVAVAAASYLLDSGDAIGWDRVMKATEMPADSSVRVSVVRLLPRFIAFQDREALVRAKLIGLLLSDGDNTVRMVAADELQHLDGADVREAFKKAANDEDDVVKGIAIRYVGAGRR